jgi:hypothetical protein
MSFMLPVSDMGGIAGGIDDDVPYLPENKPKSVTGTHKPDEIDFDEALLGQRGKVFLLLPSGGPCLAAGFFPDGSSFTAFSGREFSQPIISMGR